MNKPNAVDLNSFHGSFKNFEVCMVWYVHKKGYQKQRFWRLQSLFTNLAADTNFYSFISKTLYNNKIRRMANFAKTIICEVSKPQLEDDS